MFGDLGEVLLIVTIAFPEPCGTEELTGALFLSLEIPLTRDTVLRENPAC